MFGENPSMSHCYDIIRFSEALRFDYFTFTLRFYITDGDTAGPEFIFAEEVSSLDPEHQSLLQLDVYFFLKSF